MKTCPDCLGEMADAAQVCHSCRNRVVGKRCPDCAELVRDAAKKCPHCSHSFAREQKIATVEAFSAKADGQKANSIGCLPKASGARIKEILERMKE